MTNVVILSQIKGLSKAIQTIVQTRPILKNNLKVSVVSDALNDDVERFVDTNVIVGDPSICANVLRKKRLKWRKREEGGDHDKRNVKWVQSTFAGVEPLINEMREEEKNEEGKSSSNELGYIVTRCGGIMGQSMAQYCLTWILAFERKIFDAKGFQEQKEWDNQYMRYRSTKDVTVGILGLGDIGQSIAKTIKESCGCNVIGFKRNVDATSTKDVSFISNKLEDILTKSDYIISILPNTKETTDLLSGSTLQTCKERQPVFINVGRGNIIDEESIILALNERWVSKAVLDVFDVEPLPKSSLLWDHPNVHITPHVAALSFPEDVANVFADNAERFIQKKALEYVVDHNQGY